MERQILTKTFTGLHKNTKCNIAYSLVKIEFKNQFLVRLEPPNTLDPNSFDYKFLATLDERGQGIPNDGDKRGGGGLQM